jgi:hypothetical protein
MTRTVNGYPAGDPGVRTTATVSTVFLTRAAAIADYVANDRTTITLLGYTAAYDAPEARYIEVADTGTLEAWQFRTNGGTRRWQLDEPNPDIRHFGPNLGFDADTSTEWQNAIDYVETVHGRGTIRCAGAYCQLNSAIRISSSGVVIDGDVGNPVVFRRGADTGYMVIVGTEDGTPIARSGVRNATFQDLVGTGTYANSPYAIWYNNVNEITNNDIQLYNECMLWRGVQLSWHGNNEIFWDGTKDFSASGIGWVISASTGANARASAGIWAEGFVNIECGQIVNGGATITSSLAYGLRIAQCDGAQVACHVQAYATAGILLQDFTTFDFHLYNVTLETPFLDLGNGNGIQVIGDRAILGLNVNNAIISHRGLGSATTRYGVLITGIVQESSIHIARADGTMADLVYIGNASCNKIAVEVDSAYNIGVGNPATYDVVSIVAGSDVYVELGKIDGNGVTRSGVYFGTAIECVATGGSVKNCTNGIRFDAPSVDCSAIAIDVRGNSGTAVVIDASASGEYVRACPGASDTP